MQIASYAGEDTLGQLIRKHFDVRGRGSAARTREIEAELLKANPHLRDLEHLPSGTPIVLPDLPEVRRLEESRDVTEPVAEFVNELRKALGDLRVASREATDQDVEALENEAELLTARELRTAARKDATLHEQMAQVERRVTVQQKELEALRKLQDQRFAEASSEIEALLKRFAPGVR
jgi:phage tail protein X